MSEQKHGGGGGGGRGPPMRRMMNPPIVVHLKSGKPTDEDQVHAAQMAVEFANNMQRNHKKEVIMFLDVRGTSVALKNSPAQLKEANSGIKEFLMEGGRVIACHKCLERNSNKEDDILPGVEFSAPAKMGKIFSGPVTVVSY